MKGKFWAAPSSRGNLEFLKWIVVHLPIIQIPRWCRFAWIEASEKWTVLIAHNFSHCLLTNRLQAQPGQLQQSLLPIHSAAQSQIQMARAARKNGLVNVALDMLTRYVSFYWPCCRTKLTAMFSDGNVSGGEKWEGGGGVMRPPLLTAMWTGFEHSKKSNVLDHLRVFSWFLPTETSLYPETRKATPSSILEICGLKPQYAKDPVLLVTQQDPLI